MSEAQGHATANFRRILTKSAQWQILYGRVKISHAYNDNKTKSISPHYGTAYTLGI